jgi:hypothetical protein
MSLIRRLLVASLLIALGSSPTWAEDGAVGPFLVKPYLQLGNFPAGQAADGLVLLWQTDDASADWSVDYQAGADRPWRPAEAPTSRRIAVPSIAPHRVYRAALAGLMPGGEFSYRVRKGGEVVFASQGRARKAADQPYRFVAFGDCAQGTDEQKAVAHRAYLARPDFVMIPGDIVYARGRVSEYREKFWPVYNADEPSPALGAPLLRSTLFVAAPGNHDTATRDLEKYPDGLAYFLYWDQPLNGPPGTAGGDNTPTLQGPEANQEAFSRAAGAAYPRMASFSFDYGNAHWTVIDSNVYVDWTDPALRAWVERDLASARGATWRFVAFHHPGFNSSRKHFDEQRMRLMAEVFEAGRVDVVFSGHVHNYQRTYPLRFVPEAGDDGKPVAPRGRVAGRWTLDRSFDGITRTRPEGIIYLVTGAGGAHLYDPEQQDEPGSWQEFTHKFLSRINSLTVADVSGTNLTIRQVSANGEELDRFVVTK